MNEILSNYKSELMDINKYGSNDPLRKKYMIKKARHYFWWRLWICHNEASLDRHFVQIDRILKNAIKEILK